MTLAEVKVQHPMPWRYVALGGNVIVSDAAGKEVPLFVLLDVVVLLTNAMSRA